MSLDAEAGRKRKEAWRKLVELLPYSWFGTGAEVYHYCPPGCCSHPDEMHDKINSAIEAALLASLPVVPALNKWNKMPPPPTRTLRCRST